MLDITGQDSYENTNSNEILSLMFCEFDDDTGPKILCQKPIELINKQTFDSISTYIIPKVQLKNRIITITVGSKYRVCGYPIYIDNINKYKRNKYIFNVCCIFNIHTNTCSYEALVKKLASDLRTLEVECNFLSTVRTKEHLPKLLEQIHSSLNSDGECIIQKIGNLEHSSMFLKLIKNHVDPQIVQSFDVPVFIVDPKSFEIDDWDLTTQKVVSCINGFKTISMISKDTTIETSVVKEAIQNLLYADVVILVPIIQNSSMFVVTSNIVQYYSNQALQAESIHFAQMDKEKEGPLFYDLFFFYNLFKNGVTIRNVIDMYNPIEKNIDTKKLVLFGLIKGFLRKQHKYPISTEKQSNFGPNVKKLLNGFYNYDKICSSIVKHLTKIFKKGTTYSNLEELIDEDKDVVICIK